MTDDYIIPATYEQWRNCIEVRCNLSLTAAYIDERLTELQDGKNPKTKKYRDLYGAEQLQSTIEWFRRAGQEAKA